MRPKEAALKAHLEAFLAARKSDALAADPIRFPRSFHRREDREAFALLAAVFAYGNVKAIGTFLTALKVALGPEPAAALRAGKVPDRLPFHRFQTEADVRSALRSLGLLLRRFGTLEEAFSSVPGPVEVRLEHFAQLLRGGAGAPTPGVLQLFPLPSAGSACKRWWMFLRWVVRPEDGVDLGLWKCQTPAELRVPIDTHVARIARMLGLTGRATPDALFSLEVTAALARLCPEDPVRYDFALAHMGILKSCPSRPSAQACAPCGLRAFCSRHS